MENECITIHYSNGTITIQIAQFFPTTKKKLKVLLDAICLEKYSTPKEKKQELIDKVTNYYQSYIDQAILYLGQIEQQTKNIQQLQEKEFLSKAEKTALKSAIRIQKNYDQKLKCNQTIQDRLRRNLQDLYASL